MVVVAYSIMVVVVVVRVRAKISTGKNSSGKFDRKRKQATPYCSGNLKIFGLTFFPLKMKTKMKMGRFH